MKLLFKQRLFSWFDSYDIYDEAGNTAFVVKGELAWGHLLRIYTLHSQQLINPVLNNPKDLVSWMGSIQAQDYTMSK